MRFFFVIVCLLGLASIGAARADDLPAYGGPGDAGFRDQCPEHHVLVGFEGRMGSLTDQIKTLCAMLYSDNGMALKTDLFEAHGGSGGKPRLLRCRGGLDGLRALSIFFTSDGRRIANLSGYCVPVDGAPGTHYFCMGLQQADECNATLLEAKGFNVKDGEPLRQSCPLGEWALGVHGRYGKHVNAIGLICGVLVPKQRDVDIGISLEKGTRITPDAVYKDPKRTRTAPRDGSIYAAPAPPSQLPSSPDQPVDFGGTWSTVTAAGNRYTLTIRQAGGGVTGSYTRPDGSLAGTIEGTVSGDTLAYRWEEGGSTGSGRFKLAPGGNSFDGWWNSTRDFDAVEGSWNGTRQ
jgi:hypothetical protein